MYHIMDPASFWTDDEPFGPHEDDFQVGGGGWQVDTKARNANENLLYDAGDLTSCFPSNTAQNMSARPPSLWSLWNNNEDDHDLASGQSSVEPTPLQEDARDCSIVKIDRAQAASLWNLYNDKLSDEETQFLIDGLSAAKTNREDFLPCAWAPDSKLPALVSIQPPSSSNDKWMARYKQLEDYFRMHGHSNVPMTYPANPSLSHWVKRQRSAKKKVDQNGKSSLSEGRQALLNQLHFTWDVQSDNWQKKFRLLVDYKRKHGNACPPAKSVDDDPTGLGIWAKCQRRQYRLAQLGKRSLLDDDRVRLLESIGFEWSNPRKTP